MGDVGFAAALLASAAFGAPFGLGVTKANEGTLNLLQDPVQGAWVQFQGPEGAKLRRIGERGEVTDVPLPEELRRKGMSFTPFADGWGIAIGRRFPGGSSEERECEASEECSGSLIAAERNPSGRWTALWTLPSSAGQFFSAEAVESKGLVEIAWIAEEGPEGPVLVAAAPLGRPFLHAHVAQHILHREPEHLELLSEHRHLYLRGEFGPHGMCCSGAHVVERRLYPSGRLGPPHFLRSPLVRDMGTSVPGRAGSELYVYQDDHTLLVAHRRPWGQRYEHPRLLARNTNFNFKVSDSSNNHVVVVIPAFTAAERSLLQAVEISPTGQPSETQTVDGPKSTEGDFRWDGAIDDRGDTLVALADEQEGPAPTIWARVSGAHCHRFSPRLPLAPHAFINSSLPGAPGTIETILAVAAGRQDTFHIAWIDAQHEVHVTSATVSCVRS